MIVCRPICVCYITCLCIHVQVCMHAICIVIGIGGCLCLGRYFDLLLHVFTASTSNDR